MDYSTDGYAQLPLSSMLQSRRCRCHKNRSAHFFYVSEIAFGGVSYLRVVHRNGSIRASFLMAKVRNAPVKPLTIPRLELQAAVLETRLNQKIVEELRTLRIDQSYFWSHSMTTLQYIYNETRPFESFVSNLISEIRDHSKPTDWRYVPTHRNPADDLTRGLGVAEITLNHRYLAGPAFIRQSDST